MSENSTNQIKMGEFLLQQKIITKKQLEDALEMQKDNKERLLGEIFVTLGILSKEDMVMAMEMFLMVTDANIEHIDEWLDQDEIDLLMQKIKK